MLGSMRLAGHWTAGLIAVAAVAAAATGCSSSGPSSSAASAATSAPASAAATATASAAASSPPAASAAVATPSAAPSSAPAASPTATGSGTGSSTACATKFLAAKAGVAQGAAGSVYQVIEFTNISNSTCTLYGYPGVSLASGSPVTQVGAAASRSTATAAAVVTLAPGQTGNALLRITQALNYPSATCSPAPTTYLQIYPPDQFTPLYLAYKTTGCAKTSVNLLSVGVITAGTGG